MNINKQKINKKSCHTNTGGYAILFAVVVVSIISMIAIGLSNTTYKQLILSSLANDSQAAYYQSDTATECALYADNIIGLSAFSSPWNCGKYSDSDFFSFTMSGPSGGDPADYTFSNNVNNTDVPCFKFNITKSLAIPVLTNIFTKGYNSCKLTSPKTVERAIKVFYQ